MKTKISRAGCPHPAVIRIVSLILSFAMLFSITAGLDLSAYASNLTTGKCGDNVYYSFDSATGTLTISGNGNMYANSPFEYNTAIKYVIIENGVTSIGGAFRGCFDLISVTMPNSIKSIGSATFEDCWDLEKIIIPDGVTSIGYDAFKNCKSLKSITIPNSVACIYRGAFENTTPDNMVVENGMRIIDNCIVDVDRSIEGDIIVPKNVRLIANHAFSYCYYLTSITIPDGVTNVSDYAFYECANLTSITIPDSVTSIGDYAFYECRNLINITIPDGVTSIGDYVFYKCWDLTSITIPDSVTSISIYAFYECLSLANITIPDSVTSIGHEAFYGCKNLTDVYFNGTEKQWKEVIIGYINDPLLNATMHYIACTHNYDNGKITKNATCTENGTKIYTCAECENTKIETIAKLNHNCSWKNTNGYVVKSCDNCKSVVTNLPFTDISNCAIYGDYIEYTSVNNKFITGTNPPARTQFSPTTPITRAMFVTILYRMAGEPYSNGKNPYKTSPFTDITNTSVYYYDSACWALKNGITTEITFKPFDNVSREQTASFLFRYAQKNGKLGNSDYKEVNLKSYPDYNDVHSWAVDPLQWANYNKMITGTQQGYINPQGATQRIHATKILYGFGKACKIGNF